MCCLCLKPDLISPGDTLLAISAPAGTQLEVPIPKAVSVEPPETTTEWCFITDDLKATIVHRWFFQVPNNPAKYQIYLKSINGPIDVLLLSKCTVSSSTVVLPVPPPEDILRSAELARSASGPAEESIYPCQDSCSAKRSNVLAHKVMDEMRSLSCSKAEPNRTDPSECKYFSLCNSIHQQLQKGAESDASLFFFPHSAKFIRKTGGASTAHQR